MDLAAEEDSRRLVEVTQAGLSGCIMPSFMHTRRERQNIIKEMPPLGPGENTLGFFWHTGRPKRAAEGEAKILFCQSNKDLLLPGFLSPRAELSDLHPFCPHSVGEKGLDTLPSTMGRVFITARAVLSRGKSNFFSEFQLALVGGGRGRRGVRLMR